MVLSIDDFVGQRAATALHDGPFRSDGVDQAFAAIGGVGAPRSR